MSLDVAKLEKVRELAGGIVQARCPACAESGGDRKGEHLRIYPDGRYGCCVHPKDGEHRKRIFALAGVRKPGTFTLRLKTPLALPAARSVKAALATPSLTPPETELENGVRGVRGTPTDSSRTPRTGIFKSRARTRGESSHSTYASMDSHEKLKDLESGVRGVRGALPAATMPAADDLGTLGTPETESENGVPGVPTPPSPVSGTLGTPIFKSRAYAREGSPTVHTPVYMCKDLESGVPSVPADGFRTGRTPVSESVEAGLAAASLRTLRTAGSESEKGGPGAPTPPAEEFRTGRTGIFKSRAYAREDSPVVVDAPVYTCTDLESAVLPVLSVPEGVEGEAEQPPTPAGEHLPYLTPGGTLVIPFDSPERYHWWKPPHDQRLRVKETLAEVKERMKHAVSV